jgi:SAM-dependent methyltransferase
MWWAKVRLLSPFWFHWGAGFLAKKLRYQELRPVGQNEHSKLQPYEHLAELWHGFARNRIANYAGFIESIANRRRLQLRSVLDLACGAGSVTARLAEVVPEVIGLDISDAMLTQARARCSAFPTVRFAQGDFRGFHLEQRFEAIVCASNSLNYVRDIGELGKVFKCVAAHLQPRGLFVFDTVTEMGMQALSGYYHHANVNGTRFAIGFKYNRQDRREKSVVYLPSGFELHYRIPIDPGDVEVVAQASGLVVNDYFSYASISGRWCVGSPCFFVLTKPA